MPSDSHGLRPPFADLARAPHPAVDRGPEGRHRAQHLQRLVEHARVVRRQPRAQVGGLHRPRTAAGRHRQRCSRRVGEQPSEPCRVGVRRVVTGGAVPAHHPDDPAPVQPGGEGVVHRVVVQRAGQPGLVAVGPLGPGEGPPVGAVAPAGGVVEVRCGVQARAVGVDRHLAEVGEHQSAVALDPGGVAVVEGAPEERRALEAAPTELLAPPAQVHATHAPPRERAGSGGEPAVELGSRLDVDRASAGVPHARTRNGCAGSADRCALDPTTVRSRPPKLRSRLARSGTSAASGRPRSRSACAGRGT